MLTLNPSLYNDKVYDLKDWCTISLDDFDPINCLYKITKTIHISHQDEYNNIYYYATFPI